MPYHTAFKKATYMDENGEIIKPEEPNCYKFETFIFDSFLKLDNMEILRGKREEEFAPVKNKEGVEMCIRDRFSPIINFLGFPKEVMPLAFLRPISR